MKNDIYVLKAIEGNLRKSFTQTGKEIETIGTWFESTRHEIEGLEDIQKLIEDYRQEDGTYCFIRGNCNEKTKRNNQWRRLKENTFDIAKNWAMLDIDEIDLEEGEEYTAETLRARLSNEIDFINEETAMLIDFSSSAQIARKGEQQGKTWKAHVYLWFDEEISCKELFSRLKSYDCVDNATTISNQANYFEEPLIDENYYDCSLTKRTSFLEGKQASVPSRVSPPRNSFRFSTSKHGNKSQSQRTQELFELTQTTGRRHRGLYRFFCHIVATRQNQRYWIDTYWNSKGRSEDHDTIDKVEKVMEEAKSYVYERYLPKLDIGKHKLIESNTNNISEVITDIQGVILVKSPQSTYKTQTLHKIPKDASVLLISHRVSLIRQICEEIGLHVYEDNRIDLWQRERLGITFDSLRELINFTSKGEKLARRNYDYVIIDESEQVLGELLTTDRMMKATRQETSDVFHYVGQFIKNAKAVYVCDADISDLTRLFLEIWRTDRFTIYDNLWNEEGKALYLLPSLNATIDQIYDELEANRRVFITCETKIGANTTKEQIRIFDETKNVLCITRDNKHRYKELLNNPNKEFPLLFQGISRINNDEFFGRKLDVFIVSPIMETGVSIGSREDNENRFHTVIGIFNHPHKIFTGAKIRQALRRVRNADTHYAYIMDRNATFQDIDEIIEYIESIKPKNQPNNDINLLKTMVVKNTAISDANRTLNVQALFETVGWNLQKASQREKGAIEWLLVESKLRKEEREKLINARDIDDVEYEEQAKDIEGIRERQKHTIKKCFYEGYLDKEQSLKCPITERHIKRYSQGNIEKKYQLRDLLKGDIEELEEIWKEKGDIDYEKFIKEQLEIVFGIFGFDITRYQDNKEITLFAFQIPNETAEYLFSEDNAKALSFLLEKWHNLPLQEASKRLEDENKLRLFCKLAKIVDYDCKYIDRNVATESYKRKNKCSLTLSRVQRAIKDKVKKSKEIRKRIKNSEIPLFTKQLAERANLNREKYLENICISLSQNYEILKIEMDYLKQQYSHITLKESKPRYTRFLSNFFRTSSYHLLSEKTAKKTKEKTNRASFDELEGIYDI